MHKSWFLVLVIFKIFPTNIPCFSRRLQRNTFRLPRPLEDILKTSSRCICNTSSRGLWRRFAIMSSRRLGRQNNVTLKTSWRRLQCVFTKTNVCWVVTPIINCPEILLVLQKIEYCSVRSFFESFNYLINSINKFSFY